MGNLNLSLISENQNSKYATSNGADAKLESALCDEITTHDAATNITVTAAEFEANFHHRIGGISAADFTFTVPTTARPFLVTNGASHVATITRGSGTVIDVPAGKTRALYSGASGIYLAGSGSESGSESGSGSADIDYFSYVGNTGSGDVSGSAFAFKGNIITPARALKIAGASVPCDTVSGGSYVLAVCEINGADVIQSVALSQTTVTPAAVTGGWVTVSFTDPPSLTAGSRYAIMLGRTDGGSAFGLPVQFPVAPGIAFFNLPVLQGDICPRLAQTAPAPGQVIDQTSSAGSRVSMMLHATLQASLISGAADPAIVDNGDVSGSLACDYAAGPVQRYNLTANVTALSVSNWPPALVDAQLKLHVEMAAAYTMDFSWVTGWSGGSAPTLAIGLNTLIFTTIDGGTKIIGHAPDLGV